MSIFNAETPARRKIINKYLENKIKAPYVYSQVSTFGGTLRASAIVKVSLDPRRKWHYGILENSRYFMVHLSSNGTMEMFSKHYRLPKMRKSKVKSLVDAVARINKYISANK